MAIRDIKSNLVVKVGASLTVTADGVMTGATYDTADYDMGIMLALTALAYTDGDHAISLQDSDDGSSWADVAADGVIGEVTISSAYTPSTAIPSLGLFSNRRYVRVKITSTSVTTGAMLVPIFVFGAEQLPTA